MSSSNAQLSNIRMGSGQLNIDIKPADNLFYRIVKEETGLRLMVRSVCSVCKNYPPAKKYLKVEEALEEVRTKGYGVVTPSRS